jgi:hypothetical protein
MLHILVGNSSGDRQLILDASASGKLPLWVVPKTAAVGDGVLFCLPSAGFVARGVIQTPPKPHSGWQRRYGASIHSVTALPAPVPRAFVRDNMPEWRWPHAYTLSYVSVTGAVQEQLLALLDNVQAPFADPLTEGAPTSVLVTAYERNGFARQKCIEHYGPECVVCHFSFEATFGEQAAGYIHVHHIKAVSTRGGSYEVDPIRDLRPICPNCHAVIHRRRPPYSIAAIKRMRRYTLTRSDRTTSEA